MTTAAYKIWAAKYDTIKVTTAEMTLRAVSDGSPLTLYIATEGGQWDGIHNYEPYLKGGAAITHRAQQLANGSSLISYGDLVVVMEPGPRVDPPAILTWPQIEAGYVFEGGALVLRQGGPDLAYADWAVALQGTMGRPSGDGLERTVPGFARSKSVAETKLPLRKLSLPPTRQASHAYAVGDTYAPPAANGHYYEVTVAGISGAAEPTYPTTDNATVADGTCTVVCRTIPSSSKDKPIPLAWGWGLQAQPLLYDETNRRYYISDPAQGAIEAVLAVYVNGKPQSGNYTLSADNCILTFTSAISGQVTVDYKGRRVGGVFVERPGDFLQDVLALGGVASADLDAAALAAYNAAVSWPGQLYLTSEQSIQDVLDGLQTGLLSTWGTTRAGAYTALYWTPPSGPPDLELTGMHIISGTVSAEERLYHQVTIQGEQRLTTNSNPDSSLGQDRRIWLGEEFTARVASDDGIKTLYPLADTGEAETHLYRPDDCATLAQAWLAMYGQERMVLEVKCKLQPLSVEMGQVVRVTWDRYGLDAGRLFRVAGFVDDFVANEVTLTLWG